MLKHFLAIFLIGCVAHSQSIQIKGKVLDGSNQVPLESVTVYFASAKDSTMIDYTLTDKSGNFTLNTRKTDQALIFKVSFVGYELIEENYQKGLSESKDYGIIKLKEVGEMLGEVVVKSEAPPIRIKNDTLEFNAKSFKLREDANVEALIKQLPGVEIDAEGKITVNGKEVNQILVNGKPFFDKDGKVALQNLPAEIINKVQVTDTKTKKEELSGQIASSNNASINLTIDEDKNKGFFGKIMGGYGSSERYESSIMLNYFKGNRRLSVIGSMNNINSTGFSMNEIFDSMGGGRNYSVWTNDDGSFGINGMQFGGGSGITESKLLGINYGDEMYKKSPVNGSYFYNEAHTLNNNRSKEVRLLPDGNLTTESTSKTDSDKFAHNINTDFEFKIDSLTTLNLRPKFVKAGNTSTTTGQSFTDRSNGERANDVSNNNRMEQETGQFGTEFSLHKGFKRKGRFVSVNGEIDTRKDDSDNYSRILNTRYEDTNGDGLNDLEIEDNRNQLVRDNIKTDIYWGNIEYNEPLKDSISLQVGMAFNSSQLVRDRDGLHFNSVTNDFDVDDINLSHYQSSKTVSVGPRAGFSIDKKKFNVRFNAGTDVSDFRNQSIYQNVDTRLNKKYMLPSASVYGGYRFSKSMNLWANYSYQVDMPSGSQVLPIVDVSNPMSTITGNAGLNPNKYHYGYLSLRDYDFATKSGWSLYGGGSIYDSQVVSSTTYDSGGKAYTTFVNVKGTMNTWFGSHYSRTIKREAHSFRYGVGFSSAFNRNIGFIDGSEFKTNTWRLTPRVNLNYDCGELLSIAPRYEFTYMDSKYKNFDREQENNVTHKFTLQTTSYWPKNFVFGSDLSYNYNSRISDGFKKDFYLWNVSLGYYFMDKAFLAKVKVYDVLNQNQNNTRWLSSTFIRDEQNDVLKRYVMFSLTYSLTKFGGKEKKGSDFFMFH